MAKKYQVQKVSGKGFMNDTPLKAYENLGDEEMELIKKAGVNHIGGLLDFVSPEAVQALAKKGDNLTDADVESLQTTWQGKPLPVGTAYCLVIGDDPSSASAEAASFLAKQLKGSFAQERFVQAGGPKAFQAGSGQEANKNVGQSAKSPGGVWGQKRQGPPRV